MQNLFFGSENPAGHASSHEPQARPWAVVSRGVDPYLNKMEDRIWLPVVQCRNPDDPLSSNSIFLTRYKNPIK